MIEYVIQARDTCAPLRVELARSGLDVDTVRRRSGVTPGGLVSALEKALQASLAGESARFP